MDTKIVLVAEWDGWCGACAVERPLVLTRRGRLGLRTWLTAPVSESRPLTLTCRLCGNSEVVPAEEDDPPVLVTPDEAPTPVETTAPVTAGLSDGTTPLAPTPVGQAPLGVLEPRAPAPPSALPALVTPVHRSAELDEARGALGTALGALLAARTTQAVPALAPSVPHVPAVAAPAVPLQRTSSSDTDGLATLQLLSDGLDLLSSSRG